MKLSEEQKDFILQNWDKKDFLSLVQEAFDNEKLNGRSKEAKLVQKFLADRQLKKKGELILTDSQKEFIENSIDTLTPHEIAKIIFDDQNLKPLDKKVALIDSYAKTLEDKDTKQFPHEDYAHGDYRPPDQLSALVTKVNKHMRLHLSLKSMPTIQRKTMEAIHNFIHAPRFLQTINAFISQKTRDFFEGEFIRSVFDKPDLTPDELNIVITLCQYYVQSATLHRHLDMLNLKYEENMNDPEGKISMSLAEMVKAKAAELEKVNKAMADLTKFLGGERSKRHEKQGGGQASVVRLIEWARQEEERKQAMKLADKQAQEDVEEVDRLESIPELKTRVLGLSRSELLHG